MRRQKPALSGETDNGELVTEGEDGMTQDRKYFMRVTIELYDSADPKTRRYTAPAEHFEGVFVARDDDEARVKQARCWHVSGVAVYRELRRLQMTDRKDW